MRTQGSAEVSAVGSPGVPARLRAREGGFIGLIFARVSGDAFGRAGGGDARYVAGLREAVAAAVGHVLEAIELGDVEAAAVPGAVLVQARRAARAGVGLETVLRRYVAGHTLLGELVVEEVGRRSVPGGREMLGEIARVQLGVLDRLLVAIAAEYGRELQGEDGSSGRRLFERVRELLEEDGEGEGEDGDGDGGDVGGVAGREGGERDAGLGYALDGWHVGLIARGARAREAVLGFAGVLERPLLCVSDEDEVVWGWVGGRTVPGRSELDRALGLLGSIEGVVCACGEPARGIAGWRRTHRQARAALTVALARPRPVTRYAEVALLASALGDEALARVLLETYVVPLRDGQGALLETLRAYLGSGRSASSSAAVLGLARSTIEYRLRTIEERLGLSLQHGRPELEIALALDEIAAARRDGRQPAPPFD